MQRECSRCSPRNLMAETCLSDKIGLSNSALSRFLQSKTEKLGCHASTDISSESTQYLMSLSGFLLWETDRLSAAMGTGGMP